MGKPLNMDELTWLRQENKRLSEVQGKAAPDQQKMIDQLNKQVDDLASQVEKLRAENEELRARLAHEGVSLKQEEPSAPKLMGSKDWFR